ncbi:hypothetical protein HDE_06808 [Halotydeus destructor]|nr:hypothetical protein HDE_06808 [Halotydeus destructor]
MEPNELYKLLIRLDITEARKILFNDEAGKFKSLDMLKFFSSHQDIDRTAPTSDQRRLIAYALVEYEYIHCNEVEIEKSLNSSLRLAMVADDAIVCDVLLQAGADMFAMVDGTEDTIYDTIMASDQDAIKELVDKYFPGVWSTVEAENISDLRRLVNNWCSTDIFKGGVHLNEKALETGHEAVIRLVTGVHYTMKLIRSILAGNKMAVRSLIDDHLKELHLDFRNMSQAGAPILYYLIQREEVDITRMMVDAGSKLFTMMRLETDASIELPVFFAALMKPDLQPDLLDALVSKSNQRHQELMYRMMFNGKNVLEVAIEHNLNEEAFEVLVDRCGAKTVADRNSKCLTVRDMVTESQKPLYARLLDQYVENCAQNPMQHQGQRQILALHGYDFGQIAFQEPPVDRFLAQVYDYQSQVKKLGKAIEDNDFESFTRLSHWQPEHISDQGLFEPLLVWEGREGQENPLPLLHRAVIFNRVDFVRHILSLKPNGQSVDTLFDNLRRTALHYAYGLKELEGVRYVLREFGCSDHTLDKAGKEPLDFKDRMDARNMHKLVERLRFAEFNDPEPDAWQNASDEEDESESEAEPEKEEAGCVLS